MYTSMVLLVESLGVNWSFSKQKKTQQMFL